jgi:hypothetical protein
MEGTHSQLPEYWFETASCLGYDGEENISKHVLEI